VRSVFNPAFPYYDDFEVAGGADIGDVIGTRNGQRSDRELLFLGAPANYAAKVVGTSGSLRLTSDVYDALPDDLQELCWEFSDGVYQISAMDTDDLDDLLEQYDINWNVEASEFKAYFTYPRMKMKRSARRSSRLQSAFNLPWSGRLRKRCQKPANSKSRLVLT